MKKKKSPALWLILFLAAMLTGVIIGFCSELGDITVIADRNDVINTGGISLHILVLTGIFAVSAIFLFVWQKGTLTGGRNLLIVLLFFAAGLCFAFATAYLRKAGCFTDWHDRMLSAPSWYSNGDTETSWFKQLPEYAEQFKTRCLIFAVPALLLSIAAGILRTFSTVKKTYSAPREDADNWENEN